MAIQICSSFKCDQAHKMRDIFVIVLEFHLQKLFPVNNQIIPHTGCASQISCMSHYHALGHWGRTGWTSAYHGDMDDPAHQSLG